MFHAHLTQSPRCCAARTPPDFA